MLPKDNFYYYHKVGLPCTKLVTLALNGMWLHPKFYLCNSKTWPSNMPNQNRIAEVKPDNIILISTTHKPLGQLEIRENETVIVKAIHTLPRDGGQITTLFYFGEHSHSKNAGFLNMPI